MACGGPHERRTDAPRRRWPSGLVGMLALLVAVETWLVRAVPEPWSLAEWKVDRRFATGDAARGAEVLCFGDSLVKTGVVPAALEARLDRPAYNLGSIGTTTPATYFLLRRALAAGARPRALVLDAHELQLWSLEYRRDVAAWAGMIRPAEALDLAFESGDPGFLGAFLVHYCAPSIRRRHDLRDVIAGQLAGREPGPPITWTHVYERQHRRNRGALLFREIPTGPAPNPWPFNAPQDDEWPGRRWSPWWTNLVYLERTLELARSRGIAVFFAVPPIHPAVLAARERLGHEARHLGLIGRICGRFDNVIVVDGRHSGFGPELFLDDCHMHVRGATAFSQGLAEVMADRLDGPPGGDRWVALPKFAEPTARLVAETVDESQWAVAWEHMPR